MGSGLKASLKKRWRILSDVEFRRFRKLIRRFNREQGRGTPTRYGGLTAHSVVFDLGGYEGEWTADMRRLYDCTVHVFEPHPAFAKQLRLTFANDKKVVCHGYALGPTDGVLALSDSHDASSAFIAGGPHVEGKIRAAKSVIDALKIDEISVIKINIEGGEYAILPELITNGLIKKIRTLSIQFHNYSENDVDARLAIRANLSKTHECVWNYEFVWEQWHLRP